ncbi:MAG: hypothetical protein IMZ43_12275 [Thermoplasmata archaeon]|nr:hypothetical protein [Thermoplasmata archaeon]
MDKQRIVIFLEGGLVQRIEAEQGTEAVILDFDSDYIRKDGDDERIQPIKDVDGEISDYYISRWWINPDSKTVEYFVNQIKGEV